MGDEPPAELDPLALVHSPVGRPRVSIALVVYFVTWTDRARGLTFRTPQEFNDDFLAGWVRAASNIRITDPRYIDAGQTVVQPIVEGNPLTKKRPRSLTEYRMGPVERPA